MKLLLRIFPRKWRERYGDEVEELLASSHHPIRDRADLTRSAVLVRWDDVLAWTAKSRGRLTGLAALVLFIATAGALATQRVVNHLQHGVTELPGHWWSTLAVAPLCAGVLLSVVFVEASRRRTRRDLG